jgi:uncharacterized protein YjiS (DUF1127 family)
MTVDQDARIMILNIRTDARLFIMNWFSMRHGRLYLRNLLRSAFNDIRAANELIGK